VSTQTYVFNVRMI